MVKLNSSLDLDFLLDKDWIKSIPLNLIYIHFNLDLEGYLFEDPKGLDQTNELANK